MNELPRDCLVWMKHTTVYGSARFCTHGASRSAYIPDLALFVVTRCIHPFSIAVEADLIHGGFVGFRIGVLRNTMHRTDTLGLCLSESTSYILNDLIEEAAK